MREEEPIAPMEALLGRSLVWLMLREDTPGAFNPGRWLPAHVIWYNDSGIYVRFETLATQPEEFRPWGSIASIRPMSPYNR